MCGRKSILFLLLSVLVVFSAVGQSTPSPKQVILDNLLSYQLILEQVNLSISRSNQTIELLSQQITTLSEQLASSERRSKETIDSLTRKLEESKNLLAISEASLLDQQARYKMLLQDYEHLERSSKLYRNTTFVLGGIVLVFVAKETGHILKWW